MSIGRNKSELEWINLKSFLARYCEETNDQFSEPQYIDRPDFLIKSKCHGVTIGIEVTIAYLQDDTNSWARKFRNSPETIFTPEDATALDSGTMSEEDFAKRFGKGGHAGDYQQSIEDVITNKIRLREGYQPCERLILVIGIGDPLFGLTTLKAVLRDFVPEPNSSFEEIWINVFENLEGDCGIFRLI